MNKEPLDFCRVKKIDEKGYGFLKSLYYPRDIFFHFSQIKREDFLDKLAKMKRGDFFLYFISKELPDGKRKADKIYYSIDRVPAEYITPFLQRIISEFNDGKTNIFDLIFVFNDLRKIGAVGKEDVIKVLKAKKIMALPTTILPSLNKDEIIVFKEIINFSELESQKNKPYWFEEFIDIENRK